MSILNRNQFGHPIQEHLHNAGFPGAETYGPDHALVTHVPLETGHAIQIHHPVTASYGGRDQPNYHIEAHDPVSLNNAIERGGDMAGNKFSDAADRSLFDVPRDTGTKDMAEHEHIRGMLKSPEFQDWAKSTWHDRRNDA